ncbi:ribosomal protein S6 kinase, 52kDa, polypeptide 1 L homeolog isoform X2 [Xenopus laevis]|uniref:Ribosomal protein S6 kinase delta-1 n=1 Tax=Xenopus laevis TaxID=8355 RepID=A0A8J0V855_XENLA|nr:ribosomal protein S6 kinase, 52kDa, polypeptide 1 L homeolog isoform X2 [Xenopus laevis]
MMISQRDRGDLARFYTVTDPRRHQKGFTIYKVTARIVSRKNPEDVQEIVAWKRYSDFKKLHRDLWQIHKNIFRQQELFPPFAKAKLFGRFDESVIEERRQCAEDLLQFSANIPALYNSSQLEEFFKGGEVHDGSDLIGPAEPLTDFTDSLSDCSSDVRKDSCGLDDLTFTSISECGGLSSDSDLISLTVDRDSLSGIDDGMASNQTSPSKFLGVLPSPESSIQSIFASSHEATKSEGERERRSSFPARLKQKLSKPDYLTKAGSLITMAMKKESEEDYESAIEFYKKGVDLLLEGVQGEPSPTRREAVKKKTAEYLMRAESISSLSLKRPPEELSAVLLVLDTRTQETFILKGLRKSEHCATRKTIIPRRVPNMVRLQEYIISEESMFLVLQHAEGGKLWNYLSKYFSTRADESFDVSPSKSSHSDEDLLKHPALCPKSSLDSRGSSDRNMLSVQPLQSSLTLSSQDDSSTQDEEGRESPLKWADSASSSDEECTTSYLTLCREYSKEKVEPDTLSVEPLLGLDEQEDTPTDFVEEEPHCTTYNGLNSQITSEEPLFNEECGHGGPKPVVMADTLIKSRGSPMEFFRIDSRESNSDFGDHGSKAGTVDPYPPFQDDVDVDSEFEPARPHVGPSAIFPHDALSRGSNDSVPVISFKDAALDDVCSIDEGRPDLLVNLPGTEQMEETKVVFQHNILETDFMETKLLETPDVLLVNNSLEQLKGLNPNPLVAVEQTGSSHSQIIEQCQVNTNNKESSRTSPIDPLESRGAFSDLDTLLPITLYNKATEEISQVPREMSSGINNVRSPQETLPLVSSEMPDELTTNLVQLKIKIEDTDACFDVKKEFREEKEIHKLFQELDAKLSTASNFIIPETCIQRWAAEIVLALDALHGEGIVCRDLNPNNILLNDRGHIQLTYFSRWSEVEDSCDSDAIEKMYCAPEVGGITEETQACDWWSLGALLFELLTRKALVECHPAGINTHTTVIMPEYVSKEAQSLVQQLLQFNPLERLGAGVAGVEDIKSHPFFAGIKWDELAR